MASRLRPAVLLAAAALATACASIPTVTELAEMSPEQLCDLNNSPPIAGRSNERASAAEEELRRRNTFTDAEFDAYLARRPEVGMSSLVALCAWGRPTRINRTATRAGDHFQLVYERYLGAYTGTTTRYIYVEAGKIVSIQD